ncbi:MAG: tRNA epoxyqueuosine(34) reductase QueG [Anaerolineae bacterium]
MTLTPAALTALVVETAHTLGFDRVGIAPVGPSPDYARFERWLAAGYDGDMAYLARRALERADPRALLPDAHSLIVLALNYHQDAVPAAWRADPSRGQIAAYALGDDYHDLLKSLVFELDAALRAASGRSTLGRVFVDSGPVLERSWAQQAGLGFIGKNTCLIAPNLGSWFFLAVLLVPEVLTEHDASRALPELTLVAAPARAACGCGACTRCLVACPTDAFVEPHTLDARRCISYLTIEMRGPIPHDLRPRMGNWIFGCDICQSVCPYNRRFAQPARLAALQPRTERLAPRLLDLLALDDAGFRRHFARSPVLRAKRSGLLRNVCVALGNWGAAEAVEPLAAVLLHDDEALIRGHAAWALGQIGTDTARRILRATINETDETVRAEIARAARL